MEREFNWFKWYTPKARGLCHIVFWLVVITLYYLSYSRLADGQYRWLFIGKELLVTASLFYSASWVISKWVAKGKIYPLLIFIIFAYLWWLTCSYLFCFLAKPYVTTADERLYRYIGFVLDKGFFDLFRLDKIAVLLLDFIYMVSIPLAPKLMKAILDSSMKMVKLERDNLVLEKTVLEKSMKMIQLERDNLALELDFLKSQISPHFLFNTLNSVYRMSETNDPQTSETVLRLSNLMRYILYQGKDEKILLSKEIEFIKDYISLAKLRYGEKVPLEFNMEVVDEPYKIVPLILIQFVENAFKHGPDRSRNDVWIHISLSVSNEKLWLVVKNSVNHSATKSIYGGLGLENAKRRLKLHYPKRHKLSIEENENTYSVELIIDLI